MNPTRLHELLRGDPIRPEEVAWLRDQGSELSLERGATRLRRAGVALWKDYLAHQHGCTVAVYASLTSTQDRAAQLPPAAVVIAMRQTAGRGRLGRRWVAAGEGECLMFSLSLRDAGPMASIAVALAVAEAVEAVTPLRVGIKWPNDLLVSGRKLGGVLIEQRDGRTVAGIGLNTGLTPQRIDASPVLRERATSLAALGQDADPLRLLDECLARLLAPWGDVAPRWRERDVLVGTRITALHGGSPVTGQVVDIDAGAGLILRDDGGVMHRLRAEVTTLSC